VTVTAAGESFEIGLPEAGPPLPFACSDAEVCQFSDPQTMIGFDLPKGWGAEQPALYPVRQGDEMVDMPGTVFFELAEGGSAGERSWFLNTVDWPEDFAPCRDVALGKMCTLAVDEAAEAAFAVIAPSLRMLTPDKAATP
jgi:hypothetical protein